MTPARRPGDAMGVGARHRPTPSGRALCNWFSKYATPSRKGADRDVDAWAAWFHTLFTTAEFRYLVDVKLEESLMTALL